MIRKLSLTLLAVVVTITAFAQMPARMSYQAVVRNSSNQLLVNKQVGLKISIVQSADTNVSVFSEVHAPVTNANGLLTIAIGSINSLDVVNWGAGPYMLKTELDPDGGSNYTVTGMTQMLTVPYALYARTAGSAAGGGNMWNVVGDHAVYFGHVGINNDDKRARLVVADYNTSDSTTTIYSHANGGFSMAGFTSAETPENWRNVGVMGMVHTRQGTAGRGVSGQISGDGTEGFAVFGESRLNTGPNHGVIGYGLSREGSTALQMGGFFVARGDWDTSVGVGRGDHFGIIGRAEGKGAWGLGASLRSEFATNINRGVQGVGRGNTGPFNQGGVFFGVGAGNDATNTENLGVAGQASDNRLLNVGVRGTAFGGLNPTSKVIGVQGYAIGVGGQEAYGMDTWVNARNYRNYGLKALASGEAGGDSINYAVHAFAENAATNYGVYAVANGSGTEKVNYGIYAQAAGATDANYAGFFEGDVTVTGNLNVTGVISKGSGTFRIDHPLDPQNKYLVHSFVESPDMLNVYSGNVTTGADGTALVKLPDYFEAANTDFRYQLTVIGTFAQAIVKEEVKGNQFLVQTSEPNVKVSWQVSGIRNDAFARKNRIRPEQPKPATERGSYLHPDVYGVEKRDDNRRKAPAAERAAIAPERISE
jgi:hypothetical protein